MKRFISVAMIVCLMLGLLSGCAQIQQEHSASADGLVPGSSLGDATQDDVPASVTGKEENGGSDNAGDAIGDPTTPGGNNAGESNTPGGDNAGDQGDDSGDDDQEIPADAIVLGTFNIKCFNEGTTTDMVIQEVKTSNADIIGFQEVSNGEVKYGNVNQAKVMAEKCGYQFYDFCQAGWEGYGTCILSRFRIKNVEHKYYETQKGERRSYGRYVLDVKGTDVIYYNTHLSTQGIDSVTGPAQFQELMKRAETDTKKYPVIITGDFNLFMQDQKKLVNRNVFLAMNGGETMTFPVTNNNTTLDNIYISKAHWTPVWENVEFMGYVKSIYSEASDHDILWGYVKLK